MKGSTTMKWTRIDTYRACAWIYVLLATVAPSVG